MTTDDDYRQDTLRAYAYLGGIHVADSHEVPRLTFLSEGSRDAKECRAALARVLRSHRPLDPQLRDMLADMFYPKRPDGTGLWSERVLKVVTLKKQKDDMANTHKALFVWERVKAGSGVNAAVEAAATHFDNEREYIYRLWKLYKPQFEAIYGPIGKRQRR
jgi:hypothetical protein